MRSCGKYALSPGTLAESATPNLRSAHAVAFSSRCSNIANCTAACGDPQCSRLFSERMQHSYIQLQRSTSFHNVVSLDVFNPNAAATAGNCYTGTYPPDYGRRSGTHIPTIKRRCRIGYTTNLQSHISNHRYTVPAHAKLRNFRSLRMFNNHFHNLFFGHKSLPTLGLVLVPE